MGKTFKPDCLRGARLYVRYSLVFFLWTIVPACKHHDGRITLVWKGDKAIAITIPDDLINDISAYRVKHSLRVVLQGSKSKQGIIGEFVLLNGRVDFLPVIPLSPGLGYDIWQDERLTGRVKVPLNTGKAPELLAIYPRQDTLPENLLKFYFQFSHPMRTGSVLNHIFLLDKNKDTMRNVFLNLQPELWDGTGKVLTLWLDPGRIKRGLVLNRRLGTPLKKAQIYQLIVSRGWKDSRGLPLAKTYIKQFVAGGREGLRPDINKWELVLPKPGSDNPLIIKTHEPLDHYLLQECIMVADNKGKLQYGQNIVSANDTRLLIKPLPPWHSGKYSLIVQSKLEDLSGNNLNRVFDRDIRTDGRQHKEVFVRGFEIR